MVMNVTKMMDSEGARLFFNWVDYTIFLGLLSLSVGIGIYYGVKPTKKEETVEDYMLGGRKMKLLPVALSLIASFLSGITLLGIPSETYLYGTQLYGICIAIAMCYHLMKWFYLPVLYDLKCSSSFEYLERRFDKSTRRLASFVFTCSVILIVPVLIYIPSLAFKQVTGLPLYVLAPALCGVCIFYTSLGGLKAVVWSDAVQSGSTLISLIIVMILGIRSIGGIQKIIEINRRGERLELFNLDISPFARNTLWTTAIGSLPTWLFAFAAHPSSIQRYMSLPTLKQARISVAMMVLGIVVAKSISTFLGLIIYSKYYDCDPMAAKLVEKPGQLLPFYIMEVSQNYPGLAGLFLAGVVCTALSTMSSFLNTGAGTIFEDFIRPMMHDNPSDRTANLIMKLITVLQGILTTAIVFLVDKLGTIMQVGVTFQGVTNGVALFLFTFGMFVPWGNTAGVKAGTVAGLAVTSWLVIGTQLYIQSGDIQFATKIISIDNCPFNVSYVNSTELGYGGEGTKVLYSASVPMMYKVSYLYYSLVGLGVAMVVGCLVSLMTGRQDPDKLDEKLLIPQLRKRREDRTESYSSVPTIEIPVK